jgi:hypothetical protein
MASRKTKKQRLREKRKIFERLERNFTAKATLHGREVVVRPSGSSRMSEVIFDFIEPYRKHVQSEDELRRLITMGVVAWNAALLPSERQEKTIDQIISRVARDGAKEFRECVYEMIERKQTWFAQIKRLVLGFDLTMTERGPHLSVISTLT